MSRLKFFICAVVISLMSNSDLILTFLGANVEPSVLPMQLPSTLISPNPFSSLEVGLGPRLMLYPAL